MALLISIVLLLILTSIMFLSFQNSNEAVQKNLYEDAQNTASSLSLSLGTAKGDESMMETMINANFDSGHYIRIALINMDDVEVYERIAEQSKPNVPEWFLNTVNINVPRASAQVSSGWNPIDILYVQSDPASAYVQLYKTFRDLLISFSIIALISLIVLNSLLHVVLKPLKSVQSQAEAILQNRFIIQDNIPFTTEFKDVVKGMNAMVKKVKEIFEKGNEALARNKELMYNDPVTKLFNRRYLMLKLPDLLHLANECNGGTIMLIAFKGAETVNQKLGRQKTDSFFKSLGDSFVQLSKNFDDNVVARVNGTEFMILLPNCNSDEANNIARKLNDAMKKLKEQSALDIQDCSITIGIYRYVNGQDIPTVMTNADYALTNAKANESNNTYLFDNNDEEAAMGKEQWRILLHTSIVDDNFDLTFWPVLDTKLHVLIQKILTFSIYDHEHNSYSYGKFVSEAIALGLLPNMYLHALEKLFKNPPQDFTKVYSIRLSSDFLRAHNTYKGLKSLFERYSKSIHFSIAFEISDSIVLQNIELVRHFDALFDTYGYKVGINQFSGASKDFNYLQDIRPHFIKADVAFLLDQTRESMNALQLITDSLGIELIATGVREQKELDQLLAMNVKSIQGTLAELLGEK